MNRLLPLLPYIVAVFIGGGLGFVGVMYLPPYLALSALIFLAGIAVGLAAGLACVFRAMPRTAAHG